MLLSYYFSLFLVFFLLSLLLFPSFLFPFFCSVLLSCTFLRTFFTSSYRSFLPILISCLHSILSFSLSFTYSYFLSLLLYSSFLLISDSFLFPTCLSLPSVSLFLFASHYSVFILSFHSSWFLCCSCFSSPPCSFLLRCRVYSINHRCPYLYFSYVLHPYRNIASCFLFFPFLSFLSPSFSISRLILLPLFFLIASYFLLSFCIYRYLPLATMSCFS